MFMSVGLVLMGLILLVFSSMQFSLASEANQKDKGLAPLESGFESLKHNLLISSPFLMMAVLFVIFDVELILLLPKVFTFLYSSASINSLWTSLILLVLMGLMLEWSYFGLKWGS